MATYFWVGGSGTWSGSSSTNWSATSGGPGGAGIPTVDDTVIFNSASSGVSYVVQCDGSGACGQITTSAPATGTLTFSNSASFTPVFFNVTTFTTAASINIHAACLFNVGVSFAAGSIPVANYTLGSTTTVNFNGSGTNTQAMGIGVYVDTGNLNFCNAQTCTFSSVSVNTNNGGVFTCSGSNITINRGVTGTTESVFNVTWRGTVNMSSTNLVVGSLATPPSLSRTEIDAGTSPVWNLTGLNITVRGGASLGGVTLGPNSPTAPPTIGAVTLEGRTTQSTDMVFRVARCTTLTVRDVLVNASPATFSDPIFNASGAVAISTTAGSVAATNFAMAAGSFSTVTFGSTFTITGLSTNYAEATLSGTTVTIPSVSVTDGTFRLNGTVTVSGAITLTRASIIGSSASLTSGDISGTGQTATAGLVNEIQVGTLVCPSLTLTNTRFIAGTATVNGGVGKTFSFTVNASAPVFGNYPNISVQNFTVTTPTMSVVGTATKRVVFSGTLTVTPTPTLQFVTFISTVINNGLSSYTGTSLGTDGRSSGFVPQAARSVFCVAAGTQNFDAAIWATTPGGTGLATNYPLPQDSIIFTTAIVNAGDITLLSPSTSLYLGTITVEASSNIVSIAPDAGFSDGVYRPTRIYGSLYTATSTLTYIGRAVSGNSPQVAMGPSGLTTRYVSGRWSIGNGATGSFDLGGDFSTTYILSGTLDTYLFQVPAPDTFASLTLDTEGLTSLTCTNLSASVGTINFSGTAISATNVTFQNSAPTLNIADTPYTLTLNGTVSSGAPATYTNSSGSYRGGILVVQDGSGFGQSYFFQLQGVNVSRLTFSSNGVFGTSRTVAFAGNAFVRDFTTAGATVSWNLTRSGSGTRTLTKQNGGTVQLTGNLTTTVSASPTNTWYVSGTLSQTSGATGWVQGTAPTNTGGFFAV